MGALVDDERRFAVPLVNRARPDKHSGHFQAVEPGVAMVAAINLKSDHRPAVAVCRQAVELAWTSVGAVAVGKFERPDRPTGFRHGPLLQHRHILAPSREADERW